MSGKGDLDVVERRDDEYGGKGGGDITSGFEASIEPKHRVRERDAN